MRILLAGNPNVGKSVVFSRLTGAKVFISNFPGTTVSYAKGYMHYQGKTVEVIDLPGTYSLSSSAKDEQVTRDILSSLSEDDIVINVVDATNLERNLNFTFQLFEIGVPLVVALNMWDETKHKGIYIDAPQLESLLNVPVIPTSALRGEGIFTLINKIPEAGTIHIPPRSIHERWGNVGDIISKIQTIKQKDHTFFERLDELSLKPLTGIPIALIVIFVIFLIVRFIGESLIGYVFDPFFSEIYKPLLLPIHNYLSDYNILHTIFIGNLVEGSINFEQSFGILTTGLYVPFAMVLPYVFSFYLMLGILEDVGYLPRLSVLGDNFMHKLGLHGQSIISMILGLGCAVPGMLAARPLKSKRERFIALTLIAIAIPCASQSAMIFGLVGKFGGQYVMIVYGTLAVVWIFTGYILHKIMPGMSPELLMEIPPYRAPMPAMVLKKVGMRITSFLKEAIPYMLAGILLINILYSLGIIEFLGNLMSPIITNLMGLPQDSVSAFIMGFLRKDIAIGILSPMGLTAEQLTIASTVLTIYFPCIAAFAIMVKELGFKDMLKAAGIMLFLAIFVGTAMNLIL